MSDTKSNENKSNGQSISQNDLELRVIKIVAEKLNIDANNIKNTSDFQKDLGADSLDVVELLMEIEEEFGISISDEDSEKLATVADAIKFISSKL